ncbi:NAD(P)-dependent oxidoreductase [Aeromicrobium sp. CF4.19]|uniref:NAD(P)-dependent oxidoreductase n=1 Tax=Aeromicrobium sp. CF4.19 TaxID=3373082 RepID=UPI003EE771C6
MRISVFGATGLGLVLEETDAAVLTIRMGPGQEHLLTPATTGFLDAAHRSGTRTIVVGGAAGLRSPGLPGHLVLDDPAFVRAEWRAVASASLAQLEACRQHPFDDWSYLSPPAVLAPGPRTGRYRRGTDMLLVDAQGVSRISAADLAIAVVDEIENPGGVRHFTVVRG